MDKLVAVQDNNDPNQENIVEFEAPQRTESQDARYLQHSLHLLSMFPKEVSYQKCIIFLNLQNNAIC